MDNTICYLNTDLDLASSLDLTELVSALEGAGIPPLHSARREDGLWYATCETAEQFSESEANIAAMLAVIEALPDGPRAIWSACTRREFNIGFDCGEKPWAYNQALSNNLLGRVAAAGATLRVTLYPPQPENTEESGGSITTQKGE